MWKIFECWVCERLERELVFSPSSDRWGVDGVRGGEPPVIGCGKELPGGCVAGR